MIVDHWHWTNCRGGYCGLPQGQAGMPQRGTTQTSAAVLGPWAYNIGAANSLGCDFIRAK
jgi:hypothetical protein